VLAVIAIVTLCAACGATDSEPGALDQTTTSRVTPSTATTSAVEVTSTTTGPVASTGALLGAYVEPRGGFTDDERRQAILDHEAMIGRSLAIVNEFFSFDKEWHLDRLRWHIDSGRTLMISWNGSDADTILSGSADDVIRQRAAWTRDLGVVLLMRFFWEPDAAKGATWGYHEDPAIYHQVWRYVRAIFEEEGADNARWVWTPTTWHFITGNAPAFFPGDDVVDVIGADGYLWSPCQGPPESAVAVFGDFLEWAEARPQPIVIAEWGADDAGTKSQFVSEMHSLGSQVENLLALIVFDAVDPGGRGCNWRIDSSQDALDAYRALAADAAFGGTADQLALL
jgi:hypothetical protein